MGKVSGLIGKPNTVDCYCGYVFTVSRKVIARLLVCPNARCGRNYWYEKDLDNTTKVEPIGRYKSKKERERRLNEYAKKYSGIFTADEHLQGGQESKEDKESRSLRAKKLTNSAKVDQPKDNG